MGTGTLGGKVGAHRQAEPRLTARPILAGLFAPRNRRTTGRGFPAILALIALTFSVAAGCRTAPLVNPDPFQPATDVERLERAIKAALANRGWTIVEQQPGEITAALNVRAHRAVIAIDYDDTGVRIRHLESANLDYGVKDGQEVIHRRYNTWIKNIVHDINVYSATLS